MERRPTVRGPGPHIVPNPCVACGRTFTAMGIYSRVAKLRCCSQACVDAVRTKDERVCRRCSRALPRRAFSPMPSNPYSVSTSCTKCQEDADDYFCTSLSPRPSSYQMMRTAQQRAAAAKQPYRLTRKQVDRYYASGCDLCGRAASHLWPIKAGQPWQESNVRKVCRRCNKLVRHISYDELLLCSHEIAANNPLAPGESPYGRQHPRGRIDAKPPKPKFRPKAAVQPAAGPGYR